MYVYGGLNSYDHTQSMWKLQTKFDMYFKLNQLRYQYTLIILSNQLLYMTKNANLEH